MRFSTLDQSSVGGRIYRILLAVFGGYVFTVGFFALLSVTLSVLGTTRVEAVYWAALLSFLIYTLVIVWAAATTRLVLTSAVIVGGGAGMIGLAPLLATQLVPA